MAADTAVSLCGGRAAPGGIHGQVAGHDLRTERVTSLKNFGRLTNLAVSAEFWSGFTGTARRAGVII